DLTSELLLTANVTITTTKPANVGGSILKQTKAGDRIFDIGSGVTAVRLVGLTIENGSVTDGSTVSSNGGGILAQSQATLLSLTKCIVSGNTARSVTAAGGNGGGIYTPGALTLSGTQVLSNTAKDTGAGFANSGDGGGLWAGSFLTMTH